MRRSLFFMPTTLWDKVTSFTNYAAWQLGQSVTTQPTKNGTDTTTMATIPFFLRSANTNLVSVADSPVGGNGTCWELRGQTSAGGYGSQDAFFEADGLHYDMGGNTTNKANYVVGFWFKINHQPTSTYRLLNFGVANGAGFGFDIYSNGTLGVQNKLGTITDITSSPLTQNVWHYFVYRRTGNNFKIYLDNVLLLSLNGVGTTESGTFDTFWVRAFNALASTGKYVRIHGIHVSPNSSLTEAAATEIYNAGIGPITVNGGYTAQVTTATALFVNPTVTVTRAINFVETPATATNGHFPEPVVSTTTGISYGTEPLTASAEISYLSVSGTVNFEDTFRLATATILNPTLVIIDNDNVEVVTSITASALFVEPFNFGGQINISNSAELMEASALIGTHNSIAGVSTSYPADEATATALFQEPAFVGQGDRSVNATALTATALMTEATSAVNSSYFHEIKKINPSIYFNGTTTNYGSTPATIALDSNWSRTPDGAPLHYIFYNGNNNSYQYGGGFVGGREQMVISGTSVASLLNTSHANKQWGLEFWFKTTQAGTAIWDDGDATPNRWVTFGNITIIANDYYATGNPLNPYAPGFSLTVQVRTTSNTYEIMSTNLTNLAPSLNWNHLALYQSGNAIIMFVNSINVLGNTTAHTPDDIEPTISFYPTTLESPGFASLDEIVYYNYPLTSSIISDHYNYIKTFDPSNIFYAEPLEASAQITEASFIVVANRNIPATPITASILFVDPSVVASINISNSATALTASATAVNPFFYGNPDALINEPPMIAVGDTPQNVFRLDTAYYTYVQTNIAPFRYVTFDSPNSALDWGSDNDFGSAAPFTYNGSILEPIYGLNNNSLLSDSTSYTTSGLIMKESEHDDNWGTLGRSWHTSFWIKKDLTDTNANGLRVIANLHSYENNKHLILYQYNNYIYLQVDDKVNTFQTFQSSVNANVFDNVKHHIVISSSSNGKIHVYKNKILLIDATVTNHVVTTNSTSYLAPNTETNNRARFSVGALITPYEHTNLVTTPTASKLIIDEVHWAVTSLNQTGVNNLYAAMPFKNEIEWFADPALSNSSQIVQPTFGTGAGINAAPAQITTATFVLPTISTQIFNTFNATPLLANATAVQPFSVIGDNIRNVILNIQPFTITAMLMPAVVKITFPGATMYASAKIQYPYPYTDPYRILVLSQQYKQLTAEGFIDDVWVWRNTYTVGDLN